MSPANRQRIIGLGLLLLLLAILIPWAMQDPPDFILDRDTSEPLGLVVDWQSVEPLIAKQTVAGVEHDIAEQRHQVLEQAESRDHLLAYALRLQDFDSLVAANNARQALNDAGYSAYVRAVEGQYRLFAGPEINQQLLDQLLAKLKADDRFQFDGISTALYLP